MHCRHYLFSCAKKTKKSLNATAYAAAMESRAELKQITLHAGCFFPPPLLKHSTGCRRQLSFSAFALLRRTVIHSCNKWEVFLNAIILSKLKVRLSYKFKHIFCVR